MTRVYKNIHSYYLDNMVPEKGLYTKTVSKLVSKYKVRNPCGVSMQIVKRQNLNFMKHKTNTKQGS